MFCRVRPARQPLNFTTMDSGMQNAYSTQSSIEVERQVGRHGTLNVPYQHLRGMRLIVSERAHLRRRWDQQRLPAESQLRQQQSVPRAG